MIDKIVRFVAWMCLCAFLFLVGWLIFDLMTDPRYSRTAPLSRCLDRADDGWPHPDLYVEACYRRYAR